MTIDTTFLPQLPFSDLDSPARLTEMKPLFQTADPSEAISLFRSLSWEEEEVVAFVKYMINESPTLRDVTALIPVVQELKSSFHRIEALKAICLYHYIGFPEILMQYLWREEEVLEIFHYLANVNLKETLQILLLNYRHFNIQTPHIRFEMAKLCALHFPQKLVDDFLSFQLTEEGERFIVVEILAKYVPHEVFLFFHHFGISRDENKTRILMTAFRTCRKITENEIESLQFTSKEAELEALRRTACTNPTAAAQIISLTKDEPLIKFCILRMARGFYFDEDKIGKRCLASIDKIVIEQDRVRALKWLRDTLCSLYYDVKEWEADKEILYDDEITRVLAALMHLRNPLLRQRLTSAFRELMGCETSWLLFTQRNRSSVETNWHSKWIQPLQLLLKHSHCPEKTHFLSSVEKLGCLHPTLPDLSSFSPDKKREIIRLFQSYSAYRELLSPENYASQLLNPFLRLLKNQPSPVKQKVKRELCGFIHSKEAFINWLEEFSFPPTLKDRVEILFAQYRDAPKKFDFQFIEIYCHLLTSPDINSEPISPHLIDLFARTALPVLDKHYNAFLEILQLLYESRLEIPQKEVILKKIKPPISKTELSSLIALLTFLSTESLSDEQIDSLITAPTFFQGASTLINHIFDLKDDPHLIKSFQPHFMEKRMQGQFLAYASRIKKVESKEVLLAVQRIVRSVLTGTYLEERKNSPQMRLCQEINPDIVVWWSNLSDCTPFLCDDIIYTLEISKNPTDIILSGTEVFGSCQHLDGGTGNTKCLPGFFDDKFRLLLIRDQEGKIVSRAFLILEPTEECDGRRSLALFLELYYTRNNDPRLIRKIEELAIKIGMEGRIPVLTGSKTKLPAGFEESLRYTPGASYEGKILSQENGWCPFEYSDLMAIQAGSADAGITTGRYEISGNLQYLSFSYPIGASSSSHSMTGPTV